MKPIIVRFSDSTSLISLTLDKEKNTFEFTLIQDKPEKLKHIEFDQCRSELNDIIDKFAFDLECPCVGSRLDLKRTLHLTAPLSDRNALRLLDNLKKACIISESDHQRCIDKFDLSSFDHAVRKDTPRYR